MNPVEMNKTVEEAFADKKFVNALATIKTAEEAQKAFAMKGIEMSLEEVQALANMVGKTDAELDEATLDNVSGGSILGMAIFLGLTAAGVAIGWKAADSSCKK